MNRFEGRPKDNDLYILQDRDGDYVKEVEANLSETMHTYFIFTKDIEEARKFTGDELWSPLNVHGIGTEFTAGFSGGKAIKQL